MFVKLTKTIIEKDRFGNPVGVKTVMRKPSASVKHYTSGPQVEYTERDPVVFTKGETVEMSEASAQKYIDAGLAEEVQS